ncbi:MAG TPA: InlB B-repeat-containing protein, partial [Ferruginibacter sp.]|nr:InlB B-repeat-containing protein [Ferruginibacter sp.]HMP21990.1 InlB B-repeat-containing protein [Ferruginibacter sp.]
MPTGWTVRTSATASALGTTATLVTAATSWATTTGQFANVASANSPSASGDNATTQSGRTDRALAVRQSGSFGDPGAAFVLQIANTTGRTNFSLSFKLMQVDPTATAGRTTTWNVDYGFGASPTSFTNATTSPATITTVLGSSWGTTNVTIDFGAALNNNAGPVWIRIATKNATTGSGSRAFSAIDDFSLSWTLPTYTLTYNGNTNTSGTAPTDGSSPYAAGATVTVLGNTGGLAKTGYTFDGWNTAADGSGTNRAPASTFSMPAANTTLFAKWLINTYTVTYNGNTNTGGTAPVDGSSPYNFGSNVTILGPGTLTKTGFNFAGWNTAADGSGTAFAADDPITGIDANYTLYAQWSEAGTSTVSYNGNGNTGGTAPNDPSSPYANGSDVTVLGPGDLERTGYTFTGWNTAADGSGTPYAVSGTIADISANTILYAQWQINTYTVTYDGNTNTGGTAPVDGSSPYEFGTDVTVLGAGSLEKTFFNFTGWNTAADGSGTAYPAGGTITAIGSDITLYAQWAIITYTVTYNGNTNTGGTAPVDGGSPYEVGSDVEVLGAGDLVKTGHSFTGWNTAADGSGTAYAPAATIESLSANTILYAQWQVNTYTVTYNGNGNTGGTAPVDGSSPYNFGATVTVSANTGGLVKTGSVFNGWNTAADGSGTSYAATGSVTFTLGAANVVLYAQWLDPLYESFSYTAGTNLSLGASNWTVHSGTGAVSITSGSLSYTGLNPSAGNKVNIPGANATVSTDLNRATGITGSPTVAYFSFLLNLEDNTQLGASHGDNGYFMHFGQTTGASVSTFFGRISARSITGGYRLGIQNTSGTGANYTDVATDLSFGTTYLVVVKYDFNGASNDIATIWINPSSLGGTEPAGGTVNSSSSSSTPATFASVCIRNAAGTPKADIDEIRAGTTWASVTPAPCSGFTFTGSGNFSNPANWACGEVPASESDNEIVIEGDAVLDASYQVGAGGSFSIATGGSLSIGANAVFSVDFGGAADFNGQPVTVKSTAAGTGSVGKINGSLTGATNVTVERYIPARADAKPSWKQLCVP